MELVVGAAALAVVVWLGALSYAVLTHGRDLKLVVVALKHLAGAEKHLGGTGRGRRRTDFRVPVSLQAFLRVREHARPCRIVDLSRTGAQVVPEEGSNFPLGEMGVLTIEFGEFDQVSTHVRIVRSIEPTGSYGVQFVDQPTAFRDKCGQILRREFRQRLARA